MGRAPTSYFLRGVAFLFVGAAFFHASHIVAPEAGDPSGPLRHTLFVAINLGVAACLWLRPSALRLIFGVLVIQQVASHGSTAWRLWTEHATVDYLSIGVVVVMPLTWAALLASGSSQQARGEKGTG